MKYIIRLKEKQEIANGTMAFYFEKPEGFEYKAGQNADYFLINPPDTDTEGNKRTFSLITTPDESVIGWATRMRDTAFKRVMKNMEIGHELELDGPYGDMTLHNKSERPAVFLAGGIGITPFYSMAKDAAKRKLPHRIYLFYSNRTPQDTAFLKELTDLQSENPNFQLVSTMTNDESWSGEKGYITSKMIEKYIKELNGPIYYIAGPPAMLSALHKMLNEAGINDDDIKIEEFPGY